ncbi:MAG: hypothetical protein ABIQ58_05975 [Candidatus Limnocylindrales bacterium]
MAIAAIYVTMGLSWAGRTLLEFTGPQYYHPVTTLDFVAVWSYSLALGLLGLAVLLLARDARAGRSVMIAALVTGLAALTAAVANGLEDGAGLPGFGSLYVPAVITALLGLITLAILLWSRGHHKAAMVAGWWCAITGVSFGFGMLVLVGSVLAATDRPGLARVHAPDPPSST